MILKSEDLDGVKTLWKRVFGDSDEYLAGLFDCEITLFGRLCRGQVISSLAVLPHYYKEHKIGYIYGAMTDEAYRGRGYMRGLLCEALHELETAGYSAVFLLPASDELYGYYASCGFKKDLLTDKAYIRELPGRETCVSGSFGRESAVLKNGRLKEFALKTYKSSGGTVVTGGNFTLAYRKAGDIYAVDYACGIDIKREKYAMSVCFGGFEWDKDAHVGFLME